MLLKQNYVSMLRILKFQKLILGLLKLLLFCFTVTLPCLPLLECFGFGIFIDEHAFHGWQIISSKHERTQAFFCFIVVIGQNHHPLPKYRNLRLCSLALIYESQNLFYLTVLEVRQFIALSRVANSSKSFADLQVRLNGQLLLYVISYLLTSDL